MMIVQKPKDRMRVEADPANVERPLIVGIGGTVRDQSSSEKALRRCLFFAEQHGARTAAITGTMLPADIYDPSKTTRSAEANYLISLLRAADGVIIASPSYHGSISGHLKNALDYTEDMRTDARPYLDGRSVGLICCAMGWQAGGATLGTMRDITHALRGWPTPMGVLVNSTVTSFTEDCTCLDASIDQQLQIMASQAVGFAMMSLRDARQAPVARLAVAG